MAIAETNPFSSISTLSQHPERSHRNDNERFYNNLKFDSLEDLRNKGKQYLERSNKIPMAVLNYKTPLEKRHELIVSLLVNYNTFISLVNAK